MKGLLLSTMLLVCMSTSAIAGGIQGTVRRSNNSVAVGAEVTAINLTTGQRFRTQVAQFVYLGTWVQGYDFNSLPNGIYSVSARWYNRQTRRWETGMCNRCANLRQPYHRATVVVIIR